MEAKYMEETTGLAFAEFNQIFHAITSGICVIDKDYNVLLVNKAYSNLVGISEHESEGKKCYETFNNEICRTPDCPMKRILDGEKHIEHEIEIRRDDGIRICCAMTAVPFHSSDREFVGIVEDFRDITRYSRIKKGKIRAQTALAIAKTSAETIRSIMDAVVIAMVVTDLEGRIIRFNRGFTETFGWDEQVIKELPTKFISRADAPKVMKGMSECIRNGYVRNLECSATTEDGREITVLIDFTLMRNSRGEPKGMIGVMRDITERKRAEEARERLSHELLDKNKELEQVVYVASHDLRSPLVNIQGFSKELERAFEQLRSVIHREDTPSSIREELALLLEEDIPEAFRYIYTSTSKMDSLLSGLLRLSRMGRLTLAIKELDMNNLISNVIATFEFQAKQAGATLYVDELPSCRGDEAQINQVFSNLLDNALKYLDPERAGIIRISGWKGAKQQALESPRTRGSDKLFSKKLVWLYSPELFRYSLGNGK